jgi:high-affinity K+ transport system ATPase subunit B
MILALLGSALGSAWSRMTGHVMTVMAAITALFVLYAAGIRRGKQSAELDSLREDQKNVDIRNQTERTVSRDPDPVGSLRDRWTRP